MSSKKFNIPALLHPLREMGWHWGEDGKLHPGPTMIIENTPWVSKNLDFDCFKWNRAFHHIMSRGRMAHTHCHTCFKVVVAPRNFLELIELDKWQEESGLRCKCGIEVRDYVSRRYGGYFYSWEPGELKNEYYQPDPESEQVVRLRVVDDQQARDKGEEKYLLINMAMGEVLRRYHENWPDAPRLDEPMPVILKRGCTEFERNIGPTDSPQYRSVSDDQIEMEAALDEILDADPDHFVAKQPEVIKDHIRKKWCEYAHSVGDMTYVHWLGFSLASPPVTYHEEE